MSNDNINAHCSICGKGYHVCNSCYEQKTFTPWRTVADTIEHYKIYQCLHSFTVDQDILKANEELSKCNLTGISELLPEIQKAIEDIKNKAIKTEKILPKKNKK